MLLGGMLLAHNSLDSANRGTLKSELMDRAVERLLIRLSDRVERPTAPEWKVLQQVCSSRDRRNLCAKVFGYVREVLVPMEFLANPRKPVVWEDWHGIGLPKAASTPQTFSTLYSTTQFGDDACIFGGNFAVVSDGITKDPDSDFFSRMMVEFLRVVLPRLDGDVDTALQRAVEELEDLLIELRLPGAATLSIVYRPDSHSELYVATLGDSEVKVIRNGRSIYRSPLQRKGNRPGQLNARRPGGAGQLIIDRVRVRQNDVVLVASDGLWDNVHESDVTSQIQDVETAVRMVRRIMSQAIRGKEAIRKDCRGRCVGARRDDISILVAII
jgi:serine/threonine protein phosphatase PrpC